MGAENPETAAMTISNAPNAIIAAILEHPNAFLLSLLLDINDYEKINNPATGLTMLEGVCEVCRQQLAN